MFVKIRNTYGEYFYNCDNTIIRTFEQNEDGTYPNSFLLDVCKNKLVLATHEIEKDEKSGVFFMNENGRTVDSLTW